VIPLNTPAILSFTGDGSEQIIFPITFPTFESSNVQVEVVSPEGDKTSLVIDTHYTLSSIGIPNTNAQLNLVLSPSFPWTMPNGLTQDYVLKIKFSTNAFQPAKLRDLGRFAPEIIEKVADRLTMNVLALRELALEIQSEFQELSDKVDILEEDLSDLTNEVQDQQTQIDDVNLILDTHELRLEALESTAFAAPEVVLKSSDFNAEFNKIYVVSNQSQEISGDGITGAFEISFPFSNSASLLVSVTSPLSEVTVLESPLHYNISGGFIYLQGGPYAWISDGGFGGLEVGWTLSIVAQNIDVTLPAPEANKIIDIKKLGSNLVTLVRNGSEKIDGVAANKSLTSAKESVTLTTDGVDWFII
jgi:hypothetical protein